ncbi:hypothetical protein F5Y17DRAFT_251203 [Xylariaceae sp. FL0594]|nr:hypothetical protein F5Y17DRAFT_251203 [Xylariaceae sp. FL0594]
MFSSLLLAITAATAATAHTILTYPGWRGNNLHTNEEWPYGMQWIYPCGGIPLTKNRTYWPTTGGAIAFQPGWFQGHSTALLYINIGVGTEGPDHGPGNMSNPMLPPFQINGPSNGPYPGTVCLPQVPLPAGWVMNEGDNATIQVVEIAQHGAALFSCVDITFVKPGDPRIPELNDTNCFNNSQIGFATTYSITTQAINSAANDTQSGASRLLVGPSSLSSIWSWLGYLPVFLGAAWLMV